MTYARFTIVLVLSVSLTAFAAAQSNSHGISKKHMRSDSSAVKGTTHVVVKDKYVCPMHPDDISDQPGKCPKCGMNLVKTKPSHDIDTYHTIRVDTVKAPTGTLRQHK